MKNLAGVQICDVDIVNELLIAGIKIVPKVAIHSEVPYHFIGEQNGWEFIRAWYYWVVRPISTHGLPLELARKLHATHGKDARVNGNCTAPAPDECLNYYDSNNKRICHDPDGVHEGVFIRHKLPIGNYRFVKSLDEVPDANGYVSGYHIDTQEALNQFVKIISELS